MARRFIIPLVCMLGGCGLSGLSQRADNPAEQPLATPLSLDGTVIDRHGLPVAGAVVYLNGAPLPPTDSAGHFSAKAVSAPYNVGITDPSSANTVAFHALRTAAPVLLWPSDQHPDGSTPLAYSAKVIVQTPIGSLGSSTSVFLGGVTTEGFAVRAGRWRAGIVGSYDTTYELDVSWFSASPTLSATVHALAWTPPRGGSLNGAATDFVGYGQEAVALVAGETRTVTLTYTDVPEAELELSTDPSSPPARRHVSVEIGVARSTSFVSQAAPYTPTQTVKVPSIPGARYFIHADDPSMGSIHVLAAPGESHALGLGAVALTGSLSSALSWIPAQPGVYQVHIACPDSDLRIYTSQSGFKIGDVLNSAQVPLTLDTCATTVRAFLGPAAIDYAATVRFLRNHEAWCGGPPLLSPTEFDVGSNANATSCISTATIP